jgi:hypothetical protein
MAAPASSTTGWRGPASKTPLNHEAARFEPLSQPSTKRRDSQHHLVYAPRSIAAESRNQRPLVRSPDQEEREADSFYRHTRRLLAIQIAAWLKRVSYALSVGCSRFLRSEPRR